MLTAVMVHMCTKEGGRVECADGRA